MNLHKFIFLFLILATVVTAATVVHAQTSANSAGSSGTSESSLISITSPTADSAWSAGKSNYIRWTVDKSILKVNITLINTDTGDEAVLKSGVSASRGYYIWNISKTLAPGSYTITVSDATDDSNSATSDPFTLTVKVSSIKITSPSTKVSLSSTLQIDATVSPDNASDPTVTWSVKNGTGKATIDTTGLLTPTKVGTVTVTATANDGSKVKSTKTITLTKATATVTTNPITSVITTTTTSTANPVTTCKPNWQCVSTCSNGVYFGLYPKDLNNCGTSSAGQISCPGASTYYPDGCCVKDFDCPSGQTCNSVGKCVGIIKPAIGAISPAEGGAGTAITISGANLSGVTSVGFYLPGQTSAIISIPQTGLTATSSRVNLTLPKTFDGIVPAGACNISVTAPSGTSNTFSFNHVITQVNQPTVTINNPSLKLIGSFPWDITYSGTSSNISEIIPTILDVDPSRINTYNRIYPGTDFSYDAINNYFSMRGVSWFEYGYSPVVSTHDGTWSAGGRIQYPGEYMILVYSADSSHKLLAKSDVTFTTASSASSTVSPATTVSKAAATAAPPADACEPSWVTTAWGNCVNGNQTRTVVDINSCGVTTNKPVASQTCAVNCTSFTYSSWTKCVTGNQTRTITSSSPTGCAGGAPDVLSRGCTVVCTPKWLTTDWTTYCVNGLQTRIAVDVNNCDDDTNKPATAHTCTSTSTSIDSSTWPDITDVSPSGGEVWKIGETKTITWTLKNKNIHNISIDLLNFDTGLTSSIARGVIADAGSYSWKVGDLLGISEGITGMGSHQYKILLSSAMNSLAVSENYFSILNTKFNTDCLPEWAVSNWSSCVNNQKTRAVVDVNSCSLTAEQTVAFNKPDTIKSCDDPLTVSLEGATPIDYYTPITFSHTVGQTAGGSILLKWKITGATADMGCTTTGWERYGRANGGLNIGSVSKTLGTQIFGLDCISSKGHASDFVTVNILSNASVVSAGTCLGQDLCQDSCKAYWTNSRILPRNCCPSADTYQECTEYVNYRSGIIIAKPTTNIAPYPTSTTGGSTGGTSTGTSTGTGTTAKSLCPTGCVYNTYQFSDCLNDCTTYAKKNGGHCSLKYGGEYGFVADYNCCFNFCKASDSGGALPFVYNEPGSTLSYDKGSNCLCGSGKSSDVSSCTVPCAKVNGSIPAECKAACDAALDKCDRANKGNPDSFLTNCKYGVGWDGSYKPSASSTTSSSGSSTYSAGSSGGINISRGTSFCDCCDKCANDIIAAGGSSMTSQCPILCNAYYNGLGSANCTTGYCK